MVGSPPHARFREPTGKFSMNENDLLLVVLLLDLNSLGVIGGAELQEFLVAVADEVLKHGLVVAEAVGLVIGLEHLIQLILACSYPVAHADRGGLSGTVNDLLSGSVIKSGRGLLFSFNASTKLILSLASLECTDSIYIEFTLKPL